MRQNAGLRTRDQLIVAAVLGVATYFGLLRIAEAKCETAVGGGVLPVEPKRREEFEGFQDLRGRIVHIGDPALADRLERLREGREIWVAPRLGPGAGPSSWRPCPW